MAEQSYSFTAKSVRRIQRTVREWERWNRTANPPPFVRDGRAPLGVPIPVRNDSGEEIPAYGLMRITGVETVDGVLWYVVNKPNTTFQPFYVVNLGVALAINATGFGIIDGPVEALYTTGAPVYSEAWGVKPGQWNLERYYPGFRVLGGTTSGRVWVEQEQIHTLLAKAGASGVAARSGTTISGTSVDVYVAVGTTLTDTTFNVTAYNMAGTAVAANKYLILNEAQDKWFVNFEDCT